MATLKINGDTSGYVELVSPAVAGSTSISLDKILVSDADGNVAIGSSDDNPFSWSGSSNNVSITSQSGNDWAQLSLKGNGTGGTGINLGAGSVRHAGIFSLSGSDLSFATNATNSGTTTAERMTIKSGGNIGIGTTSPLNKFVVAEATGQHGVEIAPGTLSYIQAYDRATSDYGDLSIDAQSIRFATDNGTERMRIHTGGNVGIGTDNPHQTLHVNGGAADTTIQITNSASGSAATDGFSLTVENPSGDVNIRNREATNMRFYTSNAERMRIASNGMVQVGGVTNDSGGTKFKVGGSGNDGEITLHADTTASYITAYDRTAGLYHPIISTASEHQLNGGYVTTPSQPSFWATVSNDYTGYNSTDYSSGLIFNTALYNIGGHYSTSTGRFTAPVTGTYLLTAECYTTGAVWDQSWFTLNGSRPNGTDHVQNGQAIVGNTSMIKLNANDWVMFHPYSGNTNNLIKAAPQHTWFKGILLG